MPHGGEFSMVQCSDKRPICESSCPPAHSHIETCSTKCPACHLQVLLRSWAFLHPLSSLWIQQDCKASKGSILRQNFTHIGGITRISSSYLCVQRTLALDLWYLSSTEHRTLLFVRQKSCTSILNHVKQDYKLQSWNFFLGILEPEVSFAIISSQGSIAGQWVSPGNLYVSTVAHGFG